MNAPNRTTSQWFGTASYLCADVMIWAIILLENDTAVKKSYGMVSLVRGALDIVFTIQLYVVIYVDEAVA